MRLAVVTSHPIQYHAPLFRELARRTDLTVYFAHRATPVDQAKAGFGFEFDWDVDLLSDYRHVFLHNIAKHPSVETFAGCDTPEVGRRLAEGRFDAVLVMGWHLKSFIQTVLAAKRLGIPIMARGDSHLQTPRGTVKRVAKAFVYPGFLRLFDVALYVGERSRAYWMHYRYPATRLFFSPHCVDAEWFAQRATPEAGIALRARLGLPPERRVMLFAGKLVPFKRPLDLISAASRLKSLGLDIELLFAGSGPLEEEIVAAAKTAAVRCHMLGFCNQSEMPGVYSAANVLVMPSNGRETWGLVANEALACGTPIVVSDAVGCAPDLAESGDAGRAFGVEDVGSLTAALSDVMNRPPAATAIASKSAAYSVGPAVDGIIRAAGFTLNNRRRGFA